MSNELKINIKSTKNIPSDRKPNKNSHPVSSEKNLVRSKEKTDWIENIFDLIRI